MKTMITPSARRLETSLRDAMGPGYQLAGPGDRLLSAVAGPKAARPIDPIRR